MNKYEKRIARLEAARRQLRRRSVRFFNPLTESPESAAEAIDSDMPCALLPRELTLDEWAQLVPEQTALIAQYFATEGDGK